MFGHKFSYRWIVYEDTCGQVITQPQGRPKEQAVEATDVICVKGTEISPSVKSRNQFTYIRDLVFTLFLLLSYWSHESVTLAIFIFILLFVMSLQSFITCSRIFQAPVIW